jgi:hypothetical protein
MSQPAHSSDEKTRGFTNDGKVSTDVVNDSYGTVDPADSTGLDTEKENESRDRQKPSDADHSAGPSRP